ncbi:MAG TPA: type II toxin-antitoxin system PemK/MazF family toxin [Bacteroidia bacterium]|nr:type II toxin-antitoxin system PemK/MazF family toxin [Bacteroidia bacterium]
MTIKRWSIYRANLDPVVGSEQGKSRPVLVISEDDINNLLNIINVIPITTRKPGRSIYPNEALISANTFGLRDESIILCHQIRTLDKKRLTLLYGDIGDPKKQSEIIDALCFQLGIDRSVSTSR